MKKLLVLAAAIAVTVPGCGRSERTLIQNKGSDTMLEVAQAWAEHYREVRPDVGVAVTGGGSSGGITGIIDGTVDIANCSRPMKAREIAEAEKKGHTPVQHHVGFDGIAIYVHKDNPVESITLDQLRQIYVEGGSITRWSELGVQMPPGVDDKIVLVSRQSNSGTFEYFRESILGEEANFRLGTRDLNGSKDVVDLVANSRTAIGYSGLAYATPAVRMVPVATGADAEPVAPSIDSVIDRSYPISRPLFMYTIAAPGSERAADHVQEYLAWIKSDEGQRILLKNGYPPLRKV